MVKDFKETSQTFVDVEIFWLNHLLINFMHYQCRIERLLSFCDNSKLILNRIVIDITLVLQDFLEDTLTT